jgi:hypothetical protein
LDAVGRTPERIEALHQEATGRPVSALDATDRGEMKLVFGLDRCEHSTALVLGARDEAT